MVTGTCATRYRPQEGKVIKVDSTTPKIKPDVTINLTDDVFQQLSDGKLNGQKMSSTVLSRAFPAGWRQAL